MQTSKQSADQKPLWVRLNEERTQGDATVKHLEVHKMFGLYFGGVMTGKIYDKQGEHSLTKEEAKANAQYTVLAINNFPGIVEALESSMEEIKSLLCNYAGYSTNETYANYYGNSAIYLKAKEALNKIS